MVYVLQNGKVRLIHLLQQLFLLSIIQLIIIFENMKLSVLLQLAVSLLIGHDLFGCRR